MILTQTFLILNIQLYKSEKVDHNVTTHSTQINYNLVISSTNDFPFDHIHWLLFLSWYSH